MGPGFVPGGAPGVAGVVPGKKRNPGGHDPPSLLQPWVHQGRVISIEFRTIKPPLEPLNPPLFRRVCDDEKFS